MIFLTSEAANNLPHSNFSSLQSSFYFRYISNKFKRPNKYKCFQNTMDTTEEKLEHEFSESSHTSEVNLLLSDEGGESLQQKKFSRAPTRIHLFILYFTNFTTITILSVFLFKRNGALQTLDPSLEGVYCKSHSASILLIDKAI